jgi:hypothetical protein
VQFYFGNQHKVSFQEFPTIHHLFGCIVGCAALSMPFSRHPRCYIVVSLSVARRYQCRSRAIPDVAPLFLFGAVLSLSFSRSGVVVLLR